MKFIPLLLLAGACGAGWIYRDEIIALVESPPGSDPEPGNAPDP